MIVGDPKQSIYRWRGGRAEQFIELGKETFNRFLTRISKP
jgi:ATP-dependent exoDNAse (exonuclease V) beta subunit